MNENDGDEVVFFYSGHEVTGNIEESCEELDDDTGTDTGSIAIP